MIRKLCRRAKVRHVRTAVVVITADHFYQVFLIILPRHEGICFPCGRSDDVPYEKSWVRLWEVTAIIKLEYHTDVICKTLQKSVLFEG